MKPTEYFAVESASGLVELQAGRAITLDKPELVEDLLGAGYIVKNAKGLTLEKARVVAAEARAQKQAARMAVASDDEASAGSDASVDDAEGEPPSEGGGASESGAATE